MQRKWIAWILMVIATYVVNVNLTRAESGPLGFGSNEFSHAMETDRPDFTEGTNTITAGHLQVEIGYGYTSDGASDVQEHSIAQSLLRIGATPNLELRLGWEGYANLDQDHSTQEGVGDLSVGFKAAIAQQDRWMPTLSLISDLSLPSGSNGFGQSEVVPAVKILWAYDFIELPSLAGNVNFATPLDSEDKRYLEVSYSLTTGVELSDHFGSYLEYFALLPNSESEIAEQEHYLNGGLTYSVSENVQLDCLIGFGLNSEADDLFSGFGISFRI